MTDDLIASADKFARSALHASIAADAAVFLLHAGTALEHLSKAFLAAINGSLIAANDLDSLLHACGEGRRAGKRRSEMRTISAAESLKRSGQMIPELANLEGALKLLAEARNGVVHAALVDHDMVERTLVPFLRACDYLLAELTREREDFWADLLEVVDARLSAAAGAASVSALEKVAAAKLTFKTRFGALEEHVATFYPRALVCRVCDLALDGLAELAAAGVPGSWKLKGDEVDARDFEIESPEWDDIGE
jgi:hypothetical protein